MTTLDKNIYAIVADIGGTNARFSRVNLYDLQVDKTQSYACADFESLQCAFRHYQCQQNLEEIQFAAIAIACPVTEDIISMTNLHWKFSINTLKNQLSLSELIVLNDFSAIAMSLAFLSAEEKLKIGHGTIQSQHPMAVLGAGTGLGVAYLYPSKASFLPLASEAGHMSWTPQTEQEWFIKQFLSQCYEHVSVERLLSGPGLENIYQALATLEKMKVSELSAAEIATLALEKKSELAEKTIAQFFAILGAFAGDLALSLNTLGGVYIAGGIVPKLLPLLDHAQLRKHFEAKGRFAAYNRQIGSYVITAENPGLKGAAAYLKQALLGEHHADYKLTA